MNEQITFPHAGAAEPHDTAIADLKVPFRDAMAKLGAAVTIVTTAGAAGRAGFSATAVCSVSDTPPTMLVCLNRSSSAYNAVTANGVLCINILAGEHEDLSRLFGGKTPVAERFAAASWSTLVTGSPALDGALASLDCEVHTVSDGHSHDIFICQVKAMRQQEGSGLIYFNRRYHRLGET